MAAIPIDVAEVILLLPEDVVQRNGADAA
jgi:hypothetical protein